jgi:probable HAF family extracellular repeat protein
MTIRTSALLVLVGLVCTRDASVSTQSLTPSYLITDLGTLGGARSDALAINELAQVVGSAQRSDGTTHAFFFDGSTVKDLGTIGGPNSVATGVNDRGQIVGRSDSVIGNVKGFVITNGVRRSLGTLGGSNSAANAVSPLGDVVGSATTTNNVATRAFLLHDGIMKSLGTLGGLNSVATGINDVGDIVGSSSIAGNATTHAFVYRNGAMTDIGTLGGSSEALGINISGSEIVGRSALAGGATHAFLFSGGSMRDLGTLGGANSQALAINELSQVVGASEVAGAAGTHAFLYQRGTMIDLNTLVPPGSGWVLESANGINSSQEITGVGAINGERHAFRLLSRLTLFLSPFGVISQEDSNQPRDGAPVGRSITFVTSVTTSNGSTAEGVMFTDTMHGPVVIERVFTLHDSPCTIGLDHVSCRIGRLGDAVAFFAEEVFVTVRVTGAGVFSHTAHATAENAIPDPATDTESEQNFGAALKSFALLAPTVVGGTVVLGRAEVTPLTPVAGALIHLQSSNPEVVPMPIVTVDRPDTAHSFHIVPAVVTVPTTVTISATYGLVTISQTLTVIPPALRLIGLSRSTITGSCQTSTAKVTLTGPAPAAGARVELSTTTSGVHIPGAVTVAPGQTSASITVTADAVHAFTSGVFAASYGGVSKQLALSVRPILLTSVTLTPSTVTGGSSVSGAATIACAAPPGGLTATLTSTNAAVAAPTKTSVTFAAGTTAAAFAVRTNPVTAVTIPAIRVAANEVTKSAPLTVTP